MVEMVTSGKIPYHKDMPLSIQKIQIIAIVGTNASGKSSLAVDLAKRCNGEIVSADSRQVYRGLNIGSGKIAKREMRGIPHHLLDVASVKREYTVTHFVRDATQVIAQIAKRGKTPIVCGGTGFWIDALLLGITIPAVPPNKIFRKRLSHLSVEQLYAALQKKDPERAATIDRFNPHRLIRALEIIHATGKPVPKAKQKSNYQTLFLGVTHPKKALEKRINKRLDTRLRHGLIQEVKKLHDDGASWKRLEQLGLEYRYVSFYLKGKLSKLEMQKVLLHEIVRYAKRQLTWFQQNTSIHWIKKPGDAVRITKIFLSK
jgi:tRNA dimethylallyltransferase